MPDTEFIRLAGKPVVEAMTADCAARAASLREDGIVPTIAILRVGERPDDLSYERTVIKRSEKVGVEVRQVLLPADVDQQGLEAAIQGINQDASIHGCLMFRPLPRHLDETAACELLAPEKDLDGITSASMAGLYAGSGVGYAPCTAEACIQMLDHYGYDLKGRNVVVVGRSLVIGKPVSLLALGRNATVTMCHSRSTDLPGIMRRADVVICATGRPRAYGAECFSAGQVVLDVGINFDDEGTMCGDVDYDAVSQVVAACTPVPGGLGAITTAVLLEHLVSSSESMRG